MRRFNAGVITLLIIAAYFIATAFIPDLYLAFNYKLILALLFVLLSWQSKGKFLFFLGMAFLSTYIHDLFRLDPVCRDSYLGNCGGPFEQAKL